MPLRIEWATEHDLPALVPLFSELYQHDAPPWPMPSPQQMRAHLLRLLEPSVPHRLAIAWDADGTALGLAAVATFQSVSDPRLPQGRQMELKELFVHPAHRSTGVGAALMTWLADLAQAQGVGRIDWHVDDSNARGQAFYQRMGAQFTPHRVSMRKQLSDV
ncbi:MAG: GNAT family N-acetyltransferase [Pseudomonadota bacterium]